MRRSLKSSACCTCACCAERAEPAKRAKRAKRANVNALSVDAPRDPRLATIVNRLECTGPLGWRNIMKYATAGECVRTYAQLCTAFRPGAREKSNVFFVRHRKVMAFLSPEERVRFFSLVSTDAGRGAAALKRTAKFGGRVWEDHGAALVLANGSFALDRVEAASIRFPALEDLRVNLGHDLCDRKGFTDARRAPILAKLCTFTFVTRLDLWGNHIAVVPDAIGALTNLKYLNLSGNRIATLPASIGRLARLETLDLCFNDIAVVPDAANASIGALTNLKHLSLFRNKIATLPASIGRLTALETLNLGENTLTAVPAWIGSLTGLTTLFLSSNRIATLPTTIGGMTALTTLDLFNNQLAGLPDAIGQLTGLETLRLDSNQLTALPESIVALTNLTRLNLYNNPHLIRSAQSAAVQAWLQAHRSV